MFDFIKANKTIAEFMGAKMVLENHHGISIIQFNNKEYDLNGLRYHESWDWLMPVIDRIKSVTEEPFDLDFLKESLWFDDLEEVHTQVYHAINEINNGDIKTVEDDK